MVDPLFEVAFEKLEDKPLGKAGFAGELVERVEGRDRKADNSG